MKTMMRLSRRAFFLAPATRSFSNLGSALHCVLVLAPRVAADSSPDQPESSRHGLRDSQRQTPARSNEPPGDRSTAGTHIRAARDLRPVVSLVVVVASHSTQSCTPQSPPS